MVLNVTNSRTITKLFGPETDNWVGKKIILRAEEVDFKGERVLGLRVSLSKQESRSRRRSRPSPGLSNARSSLRSRPRCRRSSRLP